VPSPQAKPQAAPDFIPVSADTPDFIPEESAQQSAAPTDQRNSMQKGYDEFEGGTPEETGMSRWSPEGMKMRVLQGAGDTIAPLMHPIKTFQAAEHEKPSLPSMILGPGYDMAKGLIHSFEEDPVRATGQVGAGMLEGEAGGAALRGMGRVGSAVREAAMADPDVAALKALRVGPASPNAKATLSAVEGARPYLKGSQSLSDLQSRIPQAKSEIWSPYDEAVQKSSPEVQQMEARRQEISAQLRTLKQGGPEAIALAQQKGLTQAGLLDEENAIKARLDPELQKAGVDPQLIRKTFAQVSKVGNPKVMGRSTLAEKPQPYGFGRMANIKLDSPRTWLGEPLQGVRDLVAGRPMWSGSPTDVNIREAFRPGVGPTKPDFRAPTPPPMMRKPLQLEANVPGNADYGDEGLMGGPITGTPAPRVNVPAPPPTRLGIPSRAGGGEPQPMIGVRAPYHPGAAPEFTSERIEPTQFASPEIISPKGGVFRAGDIWPRPHGELPAPRMAKQLPSHATEMAPPRLPDTQSRIWAPGSQFEGEEEPDYYPVGSKFNKKGKQ
jgi:hypothetical protein